MTWQKKLEQILVIKWQISLPEEISKDVNQYEEQALILKTETRLGFENEVLV